MDHELTDMMSKLELSLLHCGLKHSEYDPSENHQAVAYLSQWIKNICDYQVRVPVCQECSEALEDENWILCYCIVCHASQWIFRPWAKRKYPAGNLVYWMDQCPKCTEV
jgi:hypothetical protein